MEKDKSEPSMLEYQLKSRTIVIASEINQKLAKSVSEQLLMLAAVSDDPIRLILNSQGGHVEAGDTIFDMIQYVEPEVKIIGTGYVASAGALIFVAAEKENRFCLPQTRFLLHQPSGGAGGSASDIQIQADEIIKMRLRLNKIFAERTGQPLERVEKDTNRDFWMDTDEAIEYGLLGKVIVKSSELD
jgi:ATP-dependent Clp protease protease subunit